jgi:hypothetical protein
MDGVACHPYFFTSFVPEMAYDWQWLDYASWIAAIDAKPLYPNGKQSGELARRRLLQPPIRRTSLRGGCYKRRALG